MFSSSKTDQTSETFNSDERIIADNGAQAINSGGGDIRIVADEAFELAEFALGSNEYLATEAMSFTRDLAGTAINEAARANREALDSALYAVKSESAQMGEQLIKIGIPALALIYLMGRLK